MGFRYLMFSTGTTYAGTIVRESATNTPLTGEKSYYTDFAIPEIQPLYLWRVDNLPPVLPTDVIVNTDANIIAYENATAPPVTSQDLVNYGEFTGVTSTKVDKVTGHTSQVPVFTAGGGLQSSNLTIGQLTGLTTYTFEGSGGTTVYTNGNHIIVKSTVPSGTTVNWGDINGTLSNQGDLYANLTWLSGETATKLPTSKFNGYTGATQPIINGALTGATYNGTGTTLISSVTNRVVHLKSISTRGGISLLGDGNNIILSGQTNLPATWGNITGTLSGQTDLWGVLTGQTAQINTKLATSDFNTYSGATLTKINSKVAKVTGATANDIVIFGTGGEVADSGIKTRVDVRSTGVATDTFLPTEKAVRDAINSSIAAAIILQGNWNATTNVPDLTVSGITTGYAWRVSVSGTTNLGGISLWAVGDLAVKSAGGWIRISSQDIAAIWGNIVGNITDQADLQAALNAKLNTSAFNIYSGATKTTIDSKLATAAFTGYSATTKIVIDSKLPTATFTGYTASTKNVNKKIQVIWTGGTTNANVVTPLVISWTNTPFPYSSDMYSWTGGTTIKILSAGTYEVQYHVLLKNDAANQTHSVGAYLVKNGVTLPVTASAGMVVGISASGELSLPPAILTFAVNDRLDLAVFRIGATGNANLVTGSVFLTLNKLT